MNFSSGPYEGERGSEVLNDVGSGP